MGQNNTGNVKSVHGKIIEKTNKYQIVKSWWLQIGHFVKKNRTLMIIKEVCWCKTWEEKYTI